MGCSASVPAPAPAAEPEDDAPVVPGAHVPQRMSMSELGRQLTSSSMGMHLSRNSAPAATKRRSSLFRRQSKEELPPAVRINPLTDLFDEFTPMVGMLFDDFKKCGHIPRSDEARREGCRAKILFDVEAPRRVSMLAAMSPSSRGSSRKSINAGAIAPELKAMAEASKRRTT